MIELYISQEEGDIDTLMDIGATGGSSFTIAASTKSHHAVVERLATVGAARTVLRMSSSSQQTIGEWFTLFTDLTNEINMLRNMVGDTDSGEGYGNFIKSA